MTRLADVLNADDRSRLSVTLASRLMSSLVAAGLETIVITADNEVASWAQEQGTDICGDPGEGLSAAAASGVGTVGDAPWIVVHADLPMVTPQTIATVAVTCLTSTVIAPSHDGGTAVIAGRGPFPFSFGVGSFQRHFASAPDATIIVSAELSIDIDTPRDLALIPELISSTDPMTVPYS
jgi:2-phospho-L-lactate guanylyltransferase